MSYVDEDIKTSDNNQKKNFEKTISSEKLMKKFVNHKASIKNKLEKSSIKNEQNNNALSISNTIIQINSKENQAIKKAGFALKGILRRNSVKEVLFKRIEKDIKKRGKTVNPLTSVFMNRTDSLLNKQSIIEQEEIKEPFINGATNFKYFINLERKINGEILNFEQDSVIKLAHDFVNKMSWVSPLLQKENKIIEIKKEEKDEINKAISNYQTSLSTENLITESNSIYKQNLK